MKPHGIPVGIQEDYHASIDAVGSRYTVLPEPDDADHDYLVYIRKLTAAQTMDLPVSQRGRVGKKTVIEFSRDMGMYGWRVGGSMSDADFPGDFISLRRDDVNLIVTASKTFHTSFLAATHICRVLNLKEKSQRIMVFEGVQYHRQSGTAERDFNMDDPFADYDDQLGVVPAILNERQAVEPMKYNDRKRRRVIQVNE